MNPCHTKKYKIIIKKLLSPHKQCKKCKKYTIYKSRYYFKTCPLNHKIRKFKVKWGYKMNLHPIITNEGWIELLRLNLG